MKLINKTTIIVGLVGVVFLVCVSFKAVRSPLFTIVTLTILSSLFTLLFIRKIVIKRIEQLNQHLTKIATLPPQTQHIDIKGNDEISSIATHINEILDNAQITHVQFEKRMIEQSQELKDKKNELQNEISKRILTERKMINKKQCLTEMAKYDNLTALPNRIFFNEILNKSINHAKRHKNDLAIMLINLDGFTKVKEAIGPANSDLVLKEIGRRFTNVLRNEDILAKLEGDEFIVLLNNIGKSKFAGTVAEKLSTICSRLLKVDTYEFSLHASIGIAIYPNDGNSLEDLLENADNALFRAKQVGGGTYRYYTEEMEIESREYLQLESALRKALHNNELTLYYQPKFRIKQGDITGLEALMRWEHPVLGIISPATFIPLAEDSGFIMQIGEWALREACRTVKQWHDEGYKHITVSLKLSQRQFHHPDITNIINKVIKTTGLNPKYLELEITEQAIMDNLESALHIIDGIKEIGAQISIDHFGTGFTSIRYLKLFPLSAIKIDQSFIKGIPNNPNDCAITNAVIALAHALGFEVVAEGVETAEQVQYLSNQQCDVVQGYFLSHPLPAAKIVLQLKKLSEDTLV